MAPEFPPVLVIAALRFEGKHLMATLEYVESKDFNSPLRVRWAAGVPPEGYRPVGGGVACFFDEPGYQVLPVSEDAQAIELGNGRYSWHEGIRNGRPRVMFILVLPPGQTIEDPFPAPAGTRIFDGRLALYWMLSSYDDDHASVEWTLTPLAADLDSEQISLNRRFLSRKRTNPAFFKVEGAAQASTPASPEPGTDLTAPFAFVSMPMNPDDDSLVDVLEAIKLAAERCHIRAERIDDQQSNDRIFGRMLQCIERARYVVVDLTYSRPNVFFEAGFAHGLGKTPIYIAKHGTKLEFNLHDYPVIFFRSLRDLRDSLERRFKGLTAASGSTL
jgi:hypothetical protein